MSIHPNDIATVQKAIKLAENLEAGAKAIRETIALLDGVDYKEDRTYHDIGDKLIDLIDAWSDKQENNNA